MTDALARLHHRLRRLVILQRFTLFTRTLLAIGFIAPGLTKVLGMPFASGLDPHTPMGTYFEAFHATGGYYVFVGVVQILAGALLLIRRTALLGACLYAAVIGNIFVLVTATQFGVGTPVLTGLMTLACGWLLAWDAYRLAPLIGTHLPEPRVGEPPIWDLFAPPRAPRRARRLTRIGYLCGFAGAFTVTLLLRGLVSADMLAMAGGAVAAGSALTLAAWLVAWRTRTTMSPA